MKRIRSIILASVLAGTSGVAFAAPQNATTPAQQTENAGQQGAVGAPDLPDGPAPDQLRKIQTDEIDADAVNLEEHKAATDKSAQKDGVQKQRHAAVDGQHMGIESATMLVGTEVHDSADENIGSIEEIVLDADQRRIAYFVLSYGGVLGIGEKWFAVPYSAFKVGEGAEYLTLDVDKNTLENAPGFDDDNWPDMADPAFHGSVYKFYHQKPYELNDQTDEPNQAVDTNDGGWDWAGWSDRGDGGMWTRRLSELIGLDIDDAQGEDLASLEDVMIDTREGRIAYALVSYGGFGGFFDDTAAIPWTSLNFDKAENVFTTQSTLDDLKNAKVEDYETIGNMEFGRRIHEQFGQEPYWKTFGYLGETDMNAADKSDMPKHSDSKTTTTPASAGEMMTITGKVRSVGSYNADSGKTGLRLRVDSEEDKSYPVRVANRSELIDKNVRVRTGDEVTVKGKTAQFGGRTILLADELTKDGTAVTLSNSEAK